MANEKVIIDRFESSFAVCEKEDNSMINIPKTNLPHEAREGDILILSDSGITIDALETQKRKEYIKKLFNSSLK